MKIPFILHEDPDDKALQAEDETGSLMPVL
jgi:hypothetical protein